jgi:ATP-binding cassette subfamily F protein 3
MLVYQRPNLLLLDEPTNHLDLEMRQALAMALQEYEGALVVVSHDRHLLRSVTDSLLLVDAGKVESFDGDLDDYRLWLLEQSREEQSAAREGGSSSDNSAAARKERKRIEAEQRQQLKPLRQKLKQLEKTLDTLQQRRVELEQQLAEPDSYSDGNRERLKSLLQEKGTLETELNSVEEQWLELSEELERHSVG